MGMETLPRCSACDFVLPVDEIPNGNGNVIHRHIYGNGMKLSERYPMGMETKVFIELGVVGIVGGIPNGNGNAATVPCATILSSVGEIPNGNGNTSLSKSLFL